MNLGQKYVVAGERGGSVSPTKVICTGDPVLWWFQIGEVGRTLRAVLEAEVVPSMTQLSDSLADWYKIAHTVYLKVNKHLLHTNVHVG